MKRENFYFAFLILAAVAFLVTEPGCYYDSEEDLYPSLSCDTVDVTYSADILPIIQSACYSCHDDANNFGGISVEGHAKLQTFALNGALLGTIKREAGWSPMPKNQGPLPDCEIEKIEVWVLDGAKDN